MDDEKRDAMIDKLSEEDIKQLAKSLAKATRNALGDLRKETDTN